MTHFCRSGGVMYELTNWRSCTLINQELYQSFRAPRNIFQTCEQCVGIIAIGIYVKKVVIWKIEQSTHTIGQGFLTMLTHNHMNFDLFKDRLSYSHPSMCAMMSNGRLWTMPSIMMLTYIAGEVLYRLKSDMRFRNFGVTRKSLIFL